VQSGALLVGELEADDLLAAPGAELGRHTHVQPVDLVLAFEQGSAGKNSLLVEQDGVDFVIGPLSGDEGLYAVKPYAKTHPNITFLNGTSAAEDTTLRSPAKNFFRFTTDGTQWMAGLGQYAYNTKHFHRVAGLKTANWI